MLTWLLLETKNKFACVQKAYYFFLWPQPELIQISALISYLKTCHLETEQAVALQAQLLFLSLFLSYVILPQNHSKTIRS